MNSILSDFEWKYWAHATCHYYHVLAMPEEIWLSGQGFGLETLAKLRDLKAHDGTSLLAYIIRKGRIGV